MDILVVGSAGFVGTNFVQYILEKYSDYNVICIDKQINNNIEKSKKYHFYQADICNAEEILKIFKAWFGFDIVVNFAVEKNNCIDSNIYGVYKLLEIIKKYKVKKFVQVSDNTKPTDLCSVSKYSSDLVALSYFNTVKTPIVVSRCTNLFGNYQQLNEFIPSMIVNALDGNKIAINEDNIRDWINVLDFCRAVDTLMHYGKSGESYILYGNKHKDIEIAQMILDYLSLSHDLIEKTQIENSNSANEVDYLLINEEFEWKPILDFKECLKDTIDWFKTNRPQVNRFSKDFL
jgi:dTDP-glucose 4,6-dehydratase